MHKLITKNKQILVFTDFDGTLLDHYTYRFDAAKSCIERLKALGVPIIPNTSKTFTEVNILQKKIGLDTPLIIENGAAVYIPTNIFPKMPSDTILKGGFWIKSFVQKRSHWQDIIKKLEIAYEGQFESFASMGVKRIAQVTGLDEASALNASERQFGEPLLWLGTEQQRNEFIDEVKSLSAFPLLGGRFLHICGNSNKGRAMQWLLDEYKRQYPLIKFSSVALGDGNNDIDMLELADTAVRISSPVHALPKLNRKNKVYTSVKKGPEGWKEVMDQLIPVS